MDSEVDGKLAKLPCSEDCDQQHKLQLEASHYWCTVGVNTGAILFNIFANYLDEGTECTLDKFAGETRQGRMANDLECCFTIQRDLHGQNYVQRAKTQFCTWGETIWEMTRGKEDLFRRGHGGPSGQQQNMSQQLPLHQRRLVTSWAALGKTFPAGWGRGSLTLLNTGETHLWCWVQLWDPQ